MSGGELLLLMVIVLLAFGARRLPDAGRLLGQGLRDFQRALNEARDAIGEERAPPPPPPPPPPRTGPSRLID